MKDLIEDARSVIRGALAQGGAACVTSSFQAECVALLHMLSEEAPGIPTLFLDTGYHFPETYEYRDQIARRLNLNLVNLIPAKTVAEQESECGILHQTAPDRCCALRKVEPLFGALQNYDLWFTGLRREQSPSRANLQVHEPFQLPHGKTLRKVSPLALWTNRDVWGYMKSAGLPVLPLYDAGYTSIGCAPCTRLPDDPANPRSGRWGGKKLECGIHIQAK